jgi:serine protein kinase
LKATFVRSVRYSLEKTYGGRHEDVKVHRVAFSEKERVGIGTFSPSDPKSQDITELTGSIDLSTIGEVGVESDPRAYRFDGELNIANRGLMEFVEMLKVDEKFLYSLLTLSQEQSIKTGRFAMIYADEVILSHSNENEYIAFAGNRKSEALQDRIILVRVPYNLRVSQEERIYDKLLHQSEALRNVHLAPNTLRVAAMFAVMTRLEEPKRQSVDIVKKMKLYDGEDVEGYKSKDVRELKEENCFRECNDGYLRRAYISQSPFECARARGMELPASTRSNALPCNQGRLRTAHTGISSEQRETVSQSYFSRAQGLYVELAKIEVQRAFPSTSFVESGALDVATNYLGHTSRRSATRNVIRGLLSTEEEDMDPDGQLLAF